VRLCADIEAEWEELALRLDAPPFLRPGWSRAWHAAFGMGESKALTITAGEELLGVAPITSTRRLLHSPTNWHTPFYGVLGADGPTHEALAQALVERVPQRLEIRFLEAGDHLLELLRGEAADRGMSTHERVIASSPYVPVQGTWAEYEQGLSKNLRKNLRRRRRQLEERGVVSVTVHEGADDLERLLDDAFRIEASGWKGERGTAIVSQPETRAFYSDIAKWAAETGDLRLTFLRVDDEPIAFDFALESGRVHYSLKSGYDEKYKIYGPGTELMRALLERAFDEGLDRFDLLGTTDEFKRAWAGEHSRELVAFQAFAPGLLGTADRFVQNQGRTMATRARSRFKHTGVVATNAVIAANGKLLETAPIAYVLVAEV
jgi:CelD/BcsL family acetyltransferase involved in cellulose biosynthesis